MARATRVNVARSSFENLVLIGELKPAAAAADLHGAEQDHLLARREDVAQKRLIRQTARSAPLDRRRAPRKFEARAPGRPRPQLSTRPAIDAATPGLSDATGCGWLGLRTESETAADRQA